MHVILKYNDNVYNVDTIKEHKDVLETNGKVIWGVIKPNKNSPGIAATRINKIKTQIANGEEVYAYLVTKGEIIARANVIDILYTSEVENNKYLVPKYYHKDLERCMAGFVFDEIEYVDPSIINNLQRYGTDRGKVALGNQTNPLYVSHINEENERLRDINDKEINVVKKLDQEQLDLEDILNHIYKYINSRGFIYSYEDICNFYLSLKTKPFLILAGISGTGKSKLVRLFSESINATSDNNRYRIISVKPDWTDSTELFGYKNISDTFIPGPLTMLLDEASKPENIDKPYFICLDEMNLARVEHYLSEYLSIIESRAFKDNGRIETDKIFPEGYLPINHKYCNLRIPDNVYIIGTVNMDDTTFAFSRKVLDRANTIEFSEVRLEELDFTEEDIEPIEVDNSIFKSRFLSLKDALSFDSEYVKKINSKIIELNNILSVSNHHFGYRVRDEIVFYMLENKINNLLDEDLAFDYQILQKILPSINGNDYFVEEILIDLYNYCNPENQISKDMNYFEQGRENLGTAKYMNSASKILYMLRGYKNGFASFW